MDLFESDPISGKLRYDPVADEIGYRELDDTRKGKLTLEALNKLKKIKIARQVEVLRRRKTLSTIYGAGGGDDDGGGFG